MKIRILGAHNTESRNTRHMSVLIDDTLALDAGGLTSALSFKAQMKIRAVLLTHHHYDHIRDIPALAMNLYLRNGRFQVYGLPSVHEVRPYESRQVEGYRVTAIPVVHSIPATGYQVTSGGDITIFYTGDTGPALADCWKHTSPQLLLIEVTSSNRWEEFASKAGHLCPILLKRELALFREMKGYLPQVIAIHINPANEDEIRPELAEVSRELGVPITVGHEGMRIEI